MSLFEDERRPGEIFFDTRINRVTEAILYCVRLQRFLRVDGSARLSIAIGHGGLKGRMLTAGNPNRVIGPERYQSTEGEVETEIQGTLDEIEANLVSKVKEIAEPLLVLFDFFKLDNSVYEDLVGNFVKGRLG